MGRPSPTPVFAPRQSWGDFFQGLLLPFSAASLILRSPRLLGLSVLSGAVTAASLFGLVWALVQWTGTLVTLLVAEPEHWLGRVLWYLLVAVTFAVLLAAGANTLPLLALTPLQDPLSEGTELLCGDWAPGRRSVSSFMGRAVVALGHTTSRVALLLLGHAGLLLFNLIPGAGHILWAVSSTLWTMAWLAVEYLDSPMTRHQFSFRDVRSVVVRRLALSLGFGASLFVLLWVPILNFFLIPVAVVGGTLLFRGLLAAGVLPQKSNGP